MPNFFGTVNRQSKAISISDLAEQGNEMLVVVGHLGKDPGVRFTQGGKEMVNGSIAVSWGKRGDPGQRTEWVNWIAMDREAEILKRYGKGDAMLIIGKLSEREYNGKKYYDLWVWSVAEPIYKVDQVSAHTHDDDIPF